MPPRSPLAHLRRARSDGEQQNNSSPWSVTMEMCSTSLEREAERGCRLVLKLSPSLHPDSHMCPHLPAPQIKTQRLFVCFILMGGLKWWHARPSPASPARPPTCSYGDDTLYWNMLTLLPWQPSQRITVLQHITPPTTSAASQMCRSPPLGVARCFGRHRASNHSPWWSDFLWKSRLFFPHTRAVNRWREATLMNRPIVGCAQYEQKLIENVTSALEMSAVLRGVAQLAI